MSEEKKADAPNIEVTRLDVRPNLCPLQDPLHLDIEFRSSEHIPDAHWDVKYIVDSTHTRHKVTLGETKETDFEEGENEVHFEVDRIDVGGVKQCHLSNVGLLSATLVSRGTDLLDVNMVVQVERNGDELHRVILNPLE